MYSYTHGNLPAPLLAIFLTNAAVHQYSTRQRYDPHVERRKTAKFMKTFIQQGPKLWLELPANIKAAKSLKSFTCNLKRYCICMY